MVGHAEVSALMSLSMEKMLAFMRRYGRHYPALCVINRAHPVEPGWIQNESVISNDSEDKEDSDDPGRLYRTLIGFKLQDEQDERNMQEVADQIARIADPDAIGFMQACLYAEYDDVNAKVPDTLQDEPAAFKVIHACYWTREDRTARLTQAPFGTDGRSASSEDIEENFREEHEVNYGVVSIAYPWSCERGRLKTRLLDPYREVRK